MILVQVRNSNDDDGTFGVAGEVAAQAAVYEVDDAVQVLRVEVHGHL